MIKQKPLNVCMGGVVVTLSTRYEQLCVEHFMSLAHTLKANYFKMGVRNFLFTKRDGFDATGVVFEYD